MTNALPKTKKVLKQISNAVATAKPAIDKSPGKLVSEELKNIEDGLQKTRVRAK